MNETFTARPLREEEQSSFRANQVSLLGEIYMAKRQTGRLAWFSSIGFFTFGLCGFIAGAAMFVWAVNNPPKTFYAAVDTTTGYISLSVGAADAPKLFNEQTNQYWIKQYVELWEDYTWETDSTHFQRVQVMSSEDQRIRYAAWHKDPLSPAQKLGRHGYVQTSNIRAFRKADGKASTSEYTIQFDRTEVDGSSIGATEHWSGDIQFRWLPQLVMTNQQRQDNPGGMMTIDFHADKDPSP